MNPICHFFWHIRTIDTRIICLFVKNDLIRLKDSGKFRICCFGIGCWIQWARGNRPLHLESLMFSWKCWLIFFLHYFNQPVHGLKLRDKFGLEKKAWCGTDWLELDVWLYGRLLPLWNYINVRSPLPFPCLE